MKKRLSCWFIPLIFTFYLSTVFGEYDPITQIGLLDGTSALLGKGTITSGLSSLKM